MQRVERSIRVRAPVERVYELWRNFQDFPRFMDNVQDVQVHGNRREYSHWKVRGPMGTSLEFDAEISEDRPNRSIGWRSIGGAVGVSGNVTFAPLEQETEVHVILQWFDPPVGAIGEVLARRLQNLERMLAEDLRRFKEVAEGRAQLAA